MRFGEGAAVGKTRSDGAPPSCLSARPAQVSVLTELSFSDLFIKSLVGPTS